MNAIQSVSGRRVMTGASSLALCVAVCAALPAQAQNPAQETQGNSAQEAVSAADIIVTGTRVGREGFENPTPTTIVSAEAIQNLAQTNASEILNNLPGFRGSFGPSTGGPALRGALATADLRGLGAERTLVLVNGLRSVPQIINGVSLINMNLIPTGSIQRVDVVTGGVSAGYGSDAVAGVVNFILKKEADGINGDVSQGISRYGDNSEFRIGLDAGTSFADGRGRVFLAGEYIDAKGVGDQFNRDWGQRAAGLYTVSATERAILDQVWNTNFTRGGLIVNTATAPSPVAVRAFAFDQSGNPYTFNFGSPRGVGEVVGQNPGAFTFPQNLSLRIPVERYAGYARIGYDVADNVEIYVAGQIAGSDTVNATFAETGTYRINYENAFLPASIRALMAPGSFFNLGRVIEDDTGQPLTYTKNRIYNGIVGAEGKFGDWGWDIAAQFGRNELNIRNESRVVRQKLLWALDAVDNGGTIVCRATMQGVAGAAGCVPFNPFGNVSPSAQAEAYVRDTSRINQVNKQTQVAANLRGEPFSTWAGPVSVAVGAEYRKVSVVQSVDDIALANGFQTAQFNLRPFSGSDNVKEAYFETVVPLARDMAFPKSLELNGAVRYTDYKSSGGVTTWKLGGTYEPFAGLRFRVARSRDIRAASLGELFAVQTGGPNTLVNPWTGASNVVIPVVQQGNQALTPEIANTLTLGAVVQPVQIPGLSLSVDYYDIKLRDAIGTVAVQQVLNLCNAGNQDFCALIDTPNNYQTITQVRNAPVNLAFRRFRGIDFEAAYRTPLGSADLTLRIMGTRAIDAIVDDGISPSGPINRAGEVGVLGNFGMPKWTVTHTIDLDSDRWHVGMQGRFISAGKYDNTYFEAGEQQPYVGTGFLINDNSVPSRYYVNLNASVNVIDDGKRKLQFYGVVNNLLDKDPPITPAGGGSTNSALYDVVGQTFKVGARFSY